MIDNGQVNSLASLMISLEPVWTLIISPNLRQFLASKSQKPKPQRRMSNADSQPQINSDPRNPHTFPLCHPPFRLFSLRPFRLCFFPTLPTIHTRSTSESVLQLNGEKKTFPTVSQGSEAAKGRPGNWVCKCGRWEWFHDGSEWFGEAGDPGICG